MTDRVAPQDPEAHGLGRLFWLTSEAIVAADIRSERITLWNPAAARLFGYSEADAVGMPLDRLVAPDLRDAHHAGIRRYRKTGIATLVGSGPVAVPAVTKSGEDIHVALTLTAGLGEEFVVAIIRDVTAQKAAEASRERMTEAMKTFVATASHDLRTPLASVLGFASVLRDQAEGLTAAQRNEFADAVVRGAQQASRLVDDLLTVSKIEADAVDVRPETVVLLPAISRVVGQWLTSAEVACDAELTAKVDGDHLDRMLTNYLTNAERHGSSPFFVEAHASEVADNAIEIHVCDSGDGVPVAFEAELFTSFAKASTDNRDGTGLGLSIVRGLARANGGDAWFERHEAGRSCFVLSLPAR